MLGLRSTAAWTPLALAAALAPGAPAQSVAESAYVELVSPRPFVWAGETAAVLLRVGVERELAEQRLVQPFARQLDVPVQVHAVWPESTHELDDRVAGAAPSHAHATFALDDEVVRARRLPDVERGGRLFLVLELERRIRARPPALVLPAPSVRLTIARSFATDALGERVPVDLESHVIPGRGLELEVRALPEEGRPAAFEGAIGRFELTASAGARDVEVGESVRVELDVRGSGAPEELAPPPFPRARGVDVLGTLVERTHGRLRVVYDVRVNDAAVREIPALELASFDPAEARYTIARSEPIALRVRARAAREHEAREPAASDAPSIEPGDAPRRATWIAVALAAAVAVAVAVRVSRARRGA